MTCRGGWFSALLLVLPPGRYKITASWVAGCVVVGMSTSACSDPVSPIRETASVDIVFRGLVNRRPDLPDTFQNCVSAVLVTRVHPSWRDFAAVSMQAVPPDTWQMTFRDVPVDEAVRFRINDKNWCDQNPTGAVRGNVSANGVQLAPNATTPGPTGEEPGFAFMVDAAGRVQQ